MNGSTISDRISTKIILEKLGCLSVNQLNAQIKLLDLWKANNIVSYPTKVQKMECNETRSTTRAITSGKLKEIGLTLIAKNTFYNDAVSAWNLAPDTIKKTLTQSGLQNS